MAIKTEIEWCDSTENPVMGCEGCELWSDRIKSCYAGTLHRRFGGVTPGYAPSFEQVTRFPGRMSRAANWRDLSGQVRPTKPWLNGVPRLIFVSDMGDSLSTSIDFEYLKSEVIENVISEKGQRHQWLWLTKRPQRMAEFSRFLSNQGMGWPDNLWPGTSITTRSSLSRVDALRHVGGFNTGRFLSVEPQLESVSLASSLDGISWVIQGGESGTAARSFDLQWARSVRDECIHEGVPFFLKQLGTKPKENGQSVRMKSRHGNDWTEWPVDLRIRETPFQVDPGLFGLVEAGESQSSKA